MRFKKILALMGIDLRPNCASTVHLESYSTPALDWKQYWGKNPEPNRPTV